MCVWCEIRWILNWNSRLEFWILKYECAERHVRAAAVRYRGQHSEYAHPELDQNILAPRISIKHNDLVFEPPVKGSKIGQQLTTNIDASLLLSSSQFVQNYSTAFVRKYNLRRCSCSYCCFSSSGWYTFDDHPDIGFLGITREEKGNGA